MLRAQLRDCQTNLRLNKESFRMFIDSVNTGADMI
jgi:hypothetical protein